MARAVTGMMVRPTRPCILGHRRAASFLDNAPTYLVFFNTAGGDPAT